MNGETMATGVESGRGPGGFLAAAVASAVSAGLWVITATVLAVDGLRSSGGTGHPDLSFYLLVGGTLAGTLLAAFTAWLLLAPIASIYRRGGLSIVSAFATVLLMLICIPVNQLGGRVGLILMLAISGTIALVLARRARRLGARE